MARRSNKADRSRKPTASSIGPAAVRPRLWWSPLVLAAAVALAYANSLSGPFVLDDEATIVQNPQVQDISRLGDVLLPPPDSPIAGRPLASLTFALNYAVGSLDVRGYHVVNIALHLVCALLLFAVVRRTVAGREADAGESSGPEHLALGAALLWAVHPLNTEVVNYLSQRTESLMAACYLLTMYAAIRAAEHFCKGVGGHLKRTLQTGTPRGRWDALAIVACALGALSKESIATVPLVVAAYDRVFLFDSWRQQLPARRRLYAGLAASWLVIAALVVTAPRAAVAGFSSGVSSWTYLLNQAPMIAEYLRLSIWPDSLVAFYGWPLPLTIAGVAAPGTLVLALLLATGIALWRRPAIGFLGVWFFVTLAPASSIVPVATEVGAERRMYLPLMALAVLAALAIEWLVTRFVRAAARTASLPARVGGTAFLAIVVALSAGLAAVTLARNREYASGLTLAQTIVERRPNGVAHHMLAEQLLHAQRNDEAMDHLRQAIALGNSRARYPLARGLAAQGRHDEAIEQLEAFLRTHEPEVPLVPRWLEPPLTEVVPARFLLGRALGLQGKWTPAAEQARRILDVVPGHVGARGLLGDAMFAQERWTEAATHYQEYLARQPADSRAWMNYGIAQVAVERFDDAIAAFTRAADLDPANPRPKELIALAREDRARLGGAR